jgi:hypothetical protein
MRTFSRAKLNSDGWFTRPATSTTRTISPRSFLKKSKRACRAISSSRKESGYVPACNEFQQIALVNGMRYGMQFDSIGTIGELPYLVDIKNSATAHPAWGVQTAAYELGIPKPLPFRNYQRIAVQLKDDATYRVHTYKEPSDGQVFLSCLAIATWKQNKKLSAA